MKSYKKRLIDKIDKCERVELQSIKNRCRDLINPNRFADMEPRCSDEYALVTIRIYDKIEFDFDVGGDDGDG